MLHVQVAALPASVRLGGPHPLHFGVGRRSLQHLGTTVKTGMSADARLFITAYGLGFLAVSLFIA